MESPASRRVSAMRQERRAIHSVMQSTSDEGWRLLATSSESLHYIKRATSRAGYALLARRDYSSPSDIFRHFLSPELIEDVLSDICNENPEVFVVDAGRGTFVNMRVSVEDVYQSLACRAFIHGEQEQAGETIKLAFKSALAFLKEHSPEQLNGYRKTYHIERKFKIKGGSIREVSLRNNFQSALVALGEVLCGDEKLFRFTGKGGIVRKVTSKPEKMGIWHYQAVVFLPTEDPFLVYTRTDNTASNMGESTSTSDIVSDWADIIIKFNQPTLLCMDSYYLAAEGRAYLLSKDIRFIAALKTDRFKNIVNLLKPQVSITGDSAWAFNSETNESAIYHFSCDKNIGKKYALSNCFDLRSDPQPKESVPIYDEYKTFFSGCDKFNQAMHNKTLPYRAPNNTHVAEERNIWNYLFTAILLNTWFAWKAILRGKNPEHQLPSFRDFCRELAIDIIRNLCVK